MVKGWPLREAAARPVKHFLVAVTSSLSSRPELTLEELQQLKWLLGGVLVLLAVSTVFTMDIGGSVLALVTASTAAAATLRPDWVASVPRWVHRLAFSFVAAFFTVDLWVTGELLPAIVRLDLLLLFYRCIAYRQRRDDLQLIVLGLFLVVLGGVLNVALAFVLQVLAFTAGALVFLLTLTLADTVSAGQAARARAAAGSGEPRRAEEESSGGVVPRWARDVQWRSLLVRVRAVTNWRIMGLGVLLFLGLVGVSALLFLAIPRFQLENSFFLERFITKKTRTGFSDTIRFGEVTEITQDNSVALSVDVSDRRGVPAAPYWRMLVLDEYLDGTFRLSPGMRRMALRQERGGTTVAGGTRERRGDPVYWTFYLESGVSRYLPLLGRFETLRFREPQNYRFARSLNVLELRAEPATMLAYRVEGMEAGAAVRDEVFAEHWREHGTNRWSAGALLLQLGVGPADRETLMQTVREIVGGNGAGADGGIADVPAFLRQLERWLGERHSYSLAPRIPAGPGDPLVRWMTSGEPGHCELFAGSLVLLARSAGLPARVVTGFRGGSWNGYSNNFTLRNSDAHAWCEVFDPASETWLRADPTPGSPAAAQDENQGEATLASRLDRSWTARLDSLRVFWYRRIVSFDQQSQLETLQAVKDATERSGRRLREALERWSQRLREWLTAPWNARRLATVGAVLGGLAVLVWLVRQARWSAVLAALAALAGIRFQPRARIDAVRTEAGRWLGKLGPRHDLPDTANTEHAEIVAELRRLRFGARETWAEPRQVFRRAREVVRRRRR